VRFRPRSARAYETFAPFEINGVSATRVRLSGAGVAPRVELEDVSKKATLDFGSARVGAAVVRELTLVNKSRLPVRVAVDPETLRALAEVQARCAFAADGGRTFKKLPVPETAVSVETGETGTDQSDERTTKRSRVRDARARV
jgi:hypothetical protein